MRSFKRDKRGRFAKRAAVKQAKFVHRRNRKIIKDFGKKEFGRELARGSSPRKAKLRTHQLTNAMTRVNDSQYIKNRMTIRHNAGVVRKARKMGIIL